MGNFAVGKKTRQREVTQLLADDAHLFGFLTEHIRPARDAGKIESAPGRGRRANLLEHTQQILTRTGGVAAAEHKPRALLRIVAYGHQLVASIQAGEVTHQIITVV